MPKILNPSLLILTAALLAGGAWLVTAQSSAEEAAHVVPAPAVDEPSDSATTEETVLAGGCFWGVQGVFQHVQGVTSAVSGYTGGDAATAHYQLVGTDRTGHAESVKITFDPHKISYGKILQIYFSVAHDPTELNHQGPDSGTQYRSTLFPSSDAQAKVAKAYIAQLDQAHSFGAKIVTTIEPGKNFYPAEEYHQDFLTRHPNYPYIVFNDLPKVASLEKLFPSVYRSEPVLVGTTAAAD